ncbi:MAG TPA: hemerythrin domain-containing protein [Burkholderiales bacterium]|nr:hemerythrin domain-containing protein [Burkholderiales bacterium]
MRQPTPTDTRNSVAYKPTLIAELKDDHRTLLKTFQDIRRATADRNAEMINHGLAAFKDGLAAHLLKEDLYFYSYTQARFTKQGDADSAETVHEFRKEMRRIAQAVKNFLSVYEGKVNAGNLGNFESDLGVVGEALGKRIGREETILYPLYQG